jgi:hypothetical protein
MRKTLTSVAVVGAAGAMLAAGGAYSVFNDAGASVGGLTAGTVKLSVNGQVPATDIFALAGPCTTRYQDGTSPTDALNMGTVNNTGCVSHFTVHNAGSLPFELSGTTVSDTNPAGLTCVTSTITDGTKSTQVLLPGADRVLTVSTATVNDVTGCQNLTDKVNAHLVATETLRPKPTTATGPWQSVFFGTPGWRSSFRINEPSNELFQLTDYQAPGDQFDVNVDGVDLGHTSNPGGCGWFCWGQSDINLAWNDPAFSKGSYDVGPGSHTVVVTFLGGPGNGYFAYRV